MITLLHGSEGYLVDQAAGALIDELRRGLSVELNFEDLAAETLAADSFVQKMSTLPFLDVARVLVLRDWGLLSGKRHKTAEVTQAAAALGSVPDSTHLVLVLHMPVPAGNPLYKVILSAEREKRGRIQRFDEPRPSERAGWVRRLAEERGLAIAPGAVRLLLERVQPDLRLIDQEITKLALYVAPSTRIDEAAVRALGSGSREEEIFALTDALGSGPPGRAAAVLQSLLDAGAEPTYLLYALVQHWRRLLIARAARDRGEDVRSLQARLPDHPFVVEKAYRQAEAFRPVDLEQGFHDLLRIEELIKLGELDARLAVEGFVLERVLA